MNQHFFVPSQVPALLLVIYLLQLSEFCAAELGTGKVILVWLYYQILLNSILLLQVNLWAQKNRRGEATST